MGGYDTHAISNADFVNVYMRYMTINERHVRITHTHHMFCFVLPV